MKKTNLSLSLSQNRTGRKKILSRQLVTQISPQRFEARVDTHTLSACLPASLSLSLSSISEKVKKKETSFSMTPSSLHVPINQSRLFPNYLVDSFVWLLRIIKGKKIKFLKRPRFKPNPESSILNAPSLTNAKLWSRKPWFGAKARWPFFLSPPKKGITDTQIQESSLFPSPSSLVLNLWGTRFLNRSWRTRNQPFGGKPSWPIWLILHGNKKPQRLRFKNNSNVRTIDLCLQTGKSLEFRAEEKEPRCRKTLETLVQTPIEKNSLFLLVVIFIVAVVPWNHHYQPWCS